MLLWPSHQLYLYGVNLESSQGKVYFINMEGPDQLFVRTIRFKTAQITQLSQITKYKKFKSTAYNMSLLSFLPFLNYFALF